MIWRIACRSNIYPQSKIVFHVIPIKLCQATFQKNQGVLLLIHHIYDTDVYATIILILNDM